MTASSMVDGLTPRERVLCALARQQPDRVPFLEPVIAESVALPLLGLPLVSTSGDEIAQTGEDVLTGPLFASSHYRPIDLADNLGLDGFGMYLFVRHEGIQQEIGGRSMVIGGGIAGRADLDRIRLPDPNNPALYEPCRRFIAANRDSGYALYAFLNLGSDPAILGMGFERFALSVYEQPDLVRDLLDLYTDWYAQVVPHLCRLGFDFLWFGDDIAFKTAPYVSPKTFRQLILPRYRKVAERVTLPWIFHSDGNLNPILDDLLSLGMSGLHPIEPEAMNLADLKRRYGDRVCLVGHISVDRLSRGTPQEIDALVKRAIQEGGPRGGYIAGSSNSIASYCRPENVRAMADAIKRYGRYPLAV